MLKLLSIFIILMSGFFPSPAFSDAQTDYLKRLDPHIKYIWDKGIIVIAKSVKNNVFKSKNLKTTIELKILPDGKLQSVNTVTGSGNDEFDRTAIEAVSDIKRVPIPPKSLISDDGSVHVFWVLSFTPPFSSISSASVRFVKYPLHLAVRKFAEQGLIKKAWLRIIKKYNSGSFDLNAVKAFAKALMLKYFPPSSADSGKLSFITSVLMQKNIPADVKFPYLSLFPDDNVFSDFISKLGSAELCALLQKNALFSKTRKIMTAEQILETGKVSCLGKLASSDAALEPFVVAAKIINKENVAANVSRLENMFKTQNKISVIKAMGYTHSGSFLPLLFKTASNKTLTSDIRSAAVISIGMLNDNSAGSKLIRFLKNKSSVIRLAAVKAIIKYNAPNKAKIRKVGSWEFETMIRKDPSVNVRIQAAKAMIFIAGQNLKNENNKYYFYMILSNKKQIVKEAGFAALDPSKPFHLKKLLSLFSKRGENSLKLKVFKKLLNYLNLPEVYKVLSAEVKKSGFKQWSYLFADESSLKNMIKSAKSDKFRLYCAMASKNKDFLINDIKSKLEKTPVNYQDLISEILSFNCIK